MILSPRETASAAMEQIANRYQAAMQMRNPYDQSAALAALFNDVGQAALGMGYGAASLVRPIRAVAQTVGENAFTGPISGSRRGQRGGVDFGQSVRGATSADEVTGVGPGLFRGGNGLDARLGIDVKPAADNLIHPMGPNGRPQGLSLNSDPLNRFIQMYGGAFPVNSLPNGLQIMQSGKPGHYVVSPSFPMSFDNYQRLLYQIELGNFNKIPKNEK